MTKLKILRSRLSALSRRRWLVRVLTGFSGLCLAALGILMAAFLVDWLLELPRLYRAGSLAVIGGTVLWAFTRFVRPSLGQRESLIDMALFVEGCHKIDTDLVAALEFEAPEADAWGSRQLEDAVIDRVSDLSRGVNVFRGMDYATMLRRGVSLAALVVLIAAGAGIFPGHAGAFLNRLLLGHAHYPTRTHIEQVAINGQSIVLVPGQEVVVKAPYGKALEISALCSGELPEAGTARLWDLENHQTAELDLRPASTQPSPQRSYVGGISKLINSVGFQLYLGDAWTDPAHVQVVPLPRVDIALRVTPPAYTASGDESLETPEGQRQIAVVENSRVDVLVRSSKPLRQSKLIIKNQEFPLARDDSQSNTERDVWVVAGESPLARVTEPIHYLIHVEDEDGLTLEKPIEGYIRLRADNPPKAFADVRTKHVLKTAVANVFYGASDDYGLAELKLKARVLRAGQKELPAKQFKLPLAESVSADAARGDGPSRSRPRRVSSMLFQLDRSFERLLAQNSQSPPAELRGEFAQRHVTLSPEATIPFARPGGGRWVIADPTHGLDFEIRHESPKLNVYRIYPLRLEGFDLQVGDQVRIELEATDFRGEMPGKSAASEAILLTVTDESGFLAATTETDLRSAEQLDAIIRIGLGDSP